jgi:hypothetical protein
MRAVSDVVVAAKGKYIGGSVIGVVQSERVHRAQARERRASSDQQCWWARLEMRRERRLRSRRLLQQAVDVEGGFGARVGEDERCDGFKLGSQWFSIGRAEWLRIRGLKRVPQRLKWHRAHQPKVWTRTRASSALVDLEAVEPPIQMLYTQQ